MVNHDVANGFNNITSFLDIMGSASKGEMKMEKAPLPPFVARGAVSRSVRVSYIYRNQQLS